MKRNVLALSIALLLGMPAMVAAKSTSRTIPVSIQLVNGSTVAAYLVGGTIATISHDGARSAPAPAGAVPIVRVNFDYERTWVLVKRVTWDKPRHQLTIDF